MTHCLLHEKPSIGAEKIEANDIDKRTDVYVLIEKLEYTRHLICSSESESPQTSLGGGEGSGGRAAPEQGDDKWARGLRLLRPPRRRCTGMRGAAMPCLTAASMPCSVHPLPRALAVRVALVVAARATRVAHCTRRSGTAGATPAPAPSANLGREENAIAYQGRHYSSFHSSPPPSSPAGGHGRWIFHLPSTPRYTRTVRSTSHGRK